MLIYTWTMPGRINRHFTGVNCENGSHVIGYTGFTGNFLYGFNFSIVVYTCFTFKSIRSKLIK